MKTFQTGLTWVLTLAFFMATILYLRVDSAIKDRKAEKIEADAKKQEAAEAAAAALAAKTLNFQVEHDADPSTNTCPVTITYSGSIDPEYDEMSFYWNQISGDIVDFADETGNTAEVKFEAEAGEYGFVLSISDPYGATCTDTVLVNIGEETNECPIPVRSPQE